MTTARVFKSGNSQAVRLPKQFRLKGPDVEIFRRGDEIVLKEKSTKGLGEVVRVLQSLPDDFMPDRDDRPAQKRRGL